MADIAKKRLSARKARHARIRRRIAGTADCPRLSVRRTLKSMVAQLIDDSKGSVSMLQVTTTSKNFQAESGKLTKTEQAAALGKMIAEKAKEKGIEAVIFDRGGYVYHGRVKALADAAREAGLKF
jgi:large subunit ribosomal protein L18